MANQQHHVDQVVDEMAGVFAVTTDDGIVHRLDLDQRVVTTQQGPPQPPAPPKESPSPVRLLTVATCRIGAPMVLLIDRGLPGVWFTRRSTANVVSISTVTGAPARGHRMVVQ